MGLCLSGIDETFNEDTFVKVHVKTTHPLMLLMNSLNWKELFKIAEPDLKSTTSKLKWWLGRKLKIRMHLGVYILQQLLNETDRGIEQQIRDNAVYAVFCGKKCVKRWHVPDHTKIAEFRGRLSPETQCELANSIAKLAVSHGFANPKDIDIDSTVQIPDMKHPATVNLLLQSTWVAKKIESLITEKFPSLISNQLAKIDYKAIKGIAQKHFFEKSKSIKKKVENRKEALKEMWQATSSVIQPMIRYARMITEPYILSSLDKRDQNLVENFVQKAPALIDDLYSHCYDGLITRSKVFSFYRNEVDCFNKNRHFKGLEYGRQFQLGLIGGNFVFSMPNSSIRMADPIIFKDMIKTHIELFQTPINSIATDKGYYSKANEKLALDFGIKEVGMQRPVRILRNLPDNPIDDETKEKLFNRRSGIEPIIGHLKRGWQMGRSRSKTDRGTESSGFASVLGFNLRQMMRYLTGNAVLESA